MSRAVLSRVEAADYLGFAVRFAGWFVAFVVGLPLIIATPVAAIWALITSITWLVSALRWEAVMGAVFFLTCAVMAFLTASEDHDE